ncbi:MAG: hypothetical protein ABJC60_03135 [Actinomycetota bacterium]
MDDGPIDPIPEDEPNFEERRALIASVEELRALLAPLSDDDRARVLDLAHRLADPPEGS